MKLLLKIKLKTVNKIIIDFFYLIKMCNFKNYEKSKNSNKRNIRKMEH